MSLNQTIPAVVIELIDETRITIDLDGRRHVEPSPAEDDSPQMEKLSRNIETVGAAMHKSVTERHEEPWRSHKPRSGKFDLSGGRLNDPSIQTVTEIISTIAVPIASLGGGAALLKISRDVFIQWLKNRLGRRIKVKAGKIAIEIHGSNNVDAAIAALNKLEKRQTTTASRSTKGVRGKQAPRKSSARKKAKQ